LRHELPDRRDALSFDSRRYLTSIIFVCGKPGSKKSFHLWAKDHEGWLAMDATAVIK
jgi:3-methylfumaryl-CoA hydratase